MPAKKSKNIKLKANKRKVIGRKVKNLRKEGVLPANIYGNKVKSQAVQVDLKEFSKVFKKAGETNIIELTISGKKRPVLIHNIQSHPVTDEFLHADFYQVDLKRKVTSQIPIELIGEAKAEKEGLGTTVQYIDEVEVEALPGDLPDKFEIDISGLKTLEDTTTIADIKTAKEVEIQNEPTQIIVKVEEVKEEEEPAPSVEEEEITEEEGDTDEEKKEEEKEGEEEKQQKEEQEEKK